MSNRRKQRQRESALIFGGVTLVVLSLAIGVAAWKYSQPVPQIPVDAAGQPLPDGQSPDGQQSPPPSAEMARIVGPRPFVNPLDGSVGLVKDWLANNANDPDIRYMEWFPPEIHENADGAFWRVRVKFRAKNRSGGFQIFNSHFLIRHNKVERVID